ncbi:MAG: hypothetical protein E7253_00925 [Lachnospiraceae bacterium]|nr:hypothetical protein [Lachnospiraceae bacterium]
MIRATALKKVIEAQEQMPGEELISQHVTKENGTSEQVTKEREAVEQVKESQVKKEEKSFWQTFLGKIKGGRKYA